MQKLILHFAEDKGQDDLYFVVLKVFDVLLNQLEVFKIACKSKGLIYLL